MSNINYLQIFIKSQLKKKSENLMHNTIVFVTLKLLMYFFLARKDMLAKIRKKDIYIFYTFDWRFNFCDHTNIMLNL